MNDSNNPIIIAPDQVVLYLGKKPLVKMSDVQTVHDNYMRTNRERTIDPLPSGKDMNNIIDVDAQVKHPAMVTKVAAKPILKFEYLEDDEKRRKIRKQESIEQYAAHIVDLTMNEDKYALPGTVRHHSIMLGTIAMSFFLMILVVIRWLSSTTKTGIATSVGAQESTVVILSLAEVASDMRRWLSVTNLIGKV